MQKACNNFRNREINTEEEGNSSNTKYDYFILYF